MRIGEFLKESRIPGTSGDIARKITVKLYGKGVFAKQENRPGSENTSYYKRKTGQFIYSKLDFMNGAFGIVPDDLDGYESTVDLPCFDFTSIEIHPEWFLHFVSRRDFYSYQGGLGNGGRKARRISPDDFLELEIDVPPLPEQKKIAEILSGIDNQIAKQQRKKCKYLHLLAGIIDRLMTHGTRGRKTIETDAGCIPENWKVGRVEDFFVLGRGRVISIPFIKEHPGPYPVFSSQSKNNGEMGRMDTFDFDGDYFTWTTDGAYAGSVFARSGKFNCTNVCGTGKAKSPAESDSKFAAYFLQRVAKRHVSYVGNPKLMNNTFADIPFALPPLDEQKEIIAVIDSVKKNIELAEEQIVSLSNLKRSVSSDLLSGRKRVTL